MKYPVKFQILLWLTLILGFAGFWLRKLLYITGTDEKGLLTDGHWAYGAIWALTLSFAALLLILCKGIKGQPTYRRSYPRSFLSAAGCFLAAAGFGRSCLTLWSRVDTAVDMYILVLSLCSVLSLCCIGFCRLQGKRPLYVLHAIVCICFAVRMVGQYRLWSSEPQLMDYCFLMTAHVALMLAGYQLSAFDAGLGSHRSLWLPGLASAYLCLVSLYGAEDPVFLLCSALWVLTNLPIPAVREEPKSC